MPHLPTIAALLVALTAVLPAQRPVRAPERAPGEFQEARPRLGPPKRLLSPEFKWQTQSGVWQSDPDTGSAHCASDGTLAEYAAATGVQLTGHWLSLRVSLSGSAPKAGVWFAGVRDSRGELLRLAF